MREIGILMSMRPQYAAALLAAMFFSGWYYYGEAHPCISPLPYSISKIDERFGLDEETVQKITAEAEAVWEEALGRQLFTYAEDAAFSIDFVYDTRQARSEAAEAEKAELDKQQSTSKSINEEYTKLLAEYDTLKKEYESKVSSYNGRLDKFNTTVASYNQNGGAPADVYEELQRTERSLKNEESNLEAEADKLSQLAKNINDVSARGNELITEYNEGVVEYNQTYTGGEEFTQGEFNGDSIAIFHFKDQTELRNVLIHELGHAIGLPHVEGGESMMYYLMDKQPTTSSLSASDLAALGSVCKPNDSMSTRFHQFFSSLFIKLHLI
jgi:myosin heavy subunit